MQSTVPKAHVSEYVGVAQQTKKHSLSLSLSHHCAGCNVALLLAAIALAVEAGDIAGLRNSAVFEECEEVAQAMEADTACDAP